jgi:tetratricopeptide (TPR) repeat protein
MPYLGSATLATVLDRVAAAKNRPARASIILDVVQDAAHQGTDPDRILLRGSYAEGVMHVGAQLAEALALLHKEGICHQDLKPSNVLLTPDGRPMLLDFNLSLDREAACNRLGGTLPYMAPEQLRALADAEPGTFLPCDARTDLFALGMILYELLAGKHPFGPDPPSCASERLAALLLERQAEGVPPLRQANPGLDLGAARIVERCLAFDPSARPGSAQELAVALRGVLSPMARVRRGLATRALACLRAAALLVATGAAAVGGVGLRSYDTPRQLQRGQEARQHPDPLRAVLLFSCALQGEPDLKPALVGRGRAYLQLGMFAPALEDFARADTQRRDGCISACRGYCLSRLGHHAEAIDQYQGAIDAGFASPELFNDLGYSYWHTHDSDKAQTALREAMARDPELSVPLFILALIDLDRALESRSGYVPDPGILAIRAAIRVSPYPAPASLYRDAARLCALAAKNCSPPHSAAESARNRAEYVEEALHYASLAVEHGWARATSNVTPPSRRWAPIRGSRAWSPGRVRKGRAPRQPCSSIYPATCLTDPRPVCADDRSRPCVGVAARR